MTGIFTDSPCPGGEGTPYKVEGGKHSVTITFECSRCGNDWTEVRYKNRFKGGWDYGFEEDGYAWPS